MRRKAKRDFAQREREAIDALTQLEPIVLATGGGAVLLADNRRCLRERGFVVYLETSVAQQTNRVRRNRNRPLLSDADPAVKLTELMAASRPSLYRDRGHHRDHRWQKGGRGRG